MMMSLLLITPILAAAYYSGKSSKSSKNVERSTGEVGSEADWVPKNTWVYLESPITMPKAIPGDSDQISLERPLGTIQQSVSEEKDPVKALGMIVKHEIEKDKAVVSLWHEFFKPSREIITRSVDQPITLVNVLQPYGLVDQQVPTGNKFYDRPIPRSTGIDRYYKRTQTVPWYLVP
jgi:hypothetical protein